MSFANILKYQKMNFGAQCENFLIQIFFKIDKKDNDISSKFKVGVGIS